MKVGKRLYSARINKWIRTQHSLGAHTGQRQW